MFGEAKQGGKEEPEALLKHFGYQKKTKTKQSLRPLFFFFSQRGGSSGQLRYSPADHC